MKKTTRITESEINRIVKKVLKEEDEKELEPITIDMIKNHIIENLRDYDSKKIESKRKIYNEVDILARDYYDIFISRLHYMSEDGMWKDFLEKIGIYE